MGVCRADPDVWESALLAASGSKTGFSAHGSPSQQASNRPKSRGKQGRTNSQLLDEVATESEDMSMKMRVTHDTPPYFIIK